VSDVDKRREFRKADYSNTSKATLPGPLPLPVPPKNDHKLQATFNEARGHVSAAGNRPFDDKLAALRAYRCAKGLCVKCAEKWSRGHQCPESIQLHVLQEVWDLFQVEEDTDQQIDNASLHSEQLFLALSVAAVSSKDAPKTMKFRGILQG